jgi:hypothetical protein
LGFHRIRRWRDMLMRLPACADTGNLGWSNRVCRHALEAVSTGDFVGLPETLARSPAAAGFGTCRWRAGVGVFLEATLLVRAFPFSQIHIGRQSSFFAAMGWEWVSGESPSASPGAGRASHSPATGTTGASHMHPQLATAACAGAECKGRPADVVDLARMTEGTLPPASLSGDQRGTTDPRETRGHSQRGRAELRDRRSEVIRIPSPVRKPTKPRLPKWIMRHAVPPL